MTCIMPLLVAYNKLLHAASAASGHHQRLMPDVPGGQSNREH